MSWVKEIINPNKRPWEEFYRNRWQHDYVVRSTHGVNCTGGCSWMVHVKNGIVTWEMQATDYPALALGPHYEPRGCQRASSAKTEAPRHDALGQRNHPQDSASLRAQAVRGSVRPFCA